MNTTQSVLNPLVANKESRLSGTGPSAVSSPGYLRRLTLSATLVLAATCAPALRSAPLAESAAVHLRADATSPVIGLIAAGSEPAVPAKGPAIVPGGWTAVELAGPHEVYVQNKDITKSLDVRPGAEIRKAPKADAPLIATAAAGDPLEITGLHGRWTQLRLNRPIVGFIKATPAATTTALLPHAAVPGVAARPTPAPGSTPAAPVAPPPSSPAAVGSADGGKSGSIVSLTDSGAGALPRTFEGRFVSTRSPFKPRRPYDWALTDEGGSRFAYLDVSRLLQTEQIEKYADRTISVFGVARPMPDSKSFVIVVESLKLK